MSSFVRADEGARPPAPQPQPENLLGRKRASLQERTPAANAKRPAVTFNLAIGDHQQTSARSTAADNAGADSRRIGHTVNIMKGSTSELQSTIAQSQLPNRTWIDEIQEQHQEPAVVSIHGMCRIEGTLLALVQLEGKEPPVLQTAADVRASAPDVYMDYLESRIVFRDASVQ